MQLDASRLNILTLPYSAIVHMREAVVSAAEQHTRRPSEELAISAQRYHDVLTAAITIADACTTVMQAANEVLPERQNLTASRHHQQIAQMAYCPMNHIFMMPDFQFPLDVLCLEVSSTCQPGISKGVSLL